MNMRLTAAFLTPTPHPVSLHRSSHPSHSLHRARPRTRPARPAPVACVHHPPPDDNDETDAPKNGLQPLHSRANDEQNRAKLGQQSVRDPLLTMDDESIQEMDELAEEWIGADLSRWEWYERMKSRRQRLLNVIEEREETLDKEFEELRRTFMEIDAVFGTKMLGKDSDVTATGWSVVALIMVLYVGLGYALFEFLVRFMTSVTPSFPY